MKRFKAVVIGGTGYGGAEMIRRLLIHPDVELVRVVPAALENGELLTKGEILHRQVSVGAEGRPGRGDDGNNEREHRAIVHHLRCPGQVRKRQRSRPVRVFAKHRCA
jgi:nucleoside-diphosphate-sugar epimerase